MGTDGDLGSQEDVDGVEDDDVDSGPLLDNHEHHGDAEWNHGLFGPKFALHWGLWLAEREIRL